MTGEPDRDRLQPALRFVDDARLAYLASETPLPAGHALRLDEAYRRAHLPLVAPAHPDVIARDAARGYRMGRHATRWSLVVPVDWAALEAAPAFRALRAELEASPLTGKLAHAMEKKRRGVLHVTLCGGLGEGPPPDWHEWQARLRGVAPFSAMLRGLFSGNINLGRLYLKLYPEERDGNAATHLQHALGRPGTALYVMGWHMLVDHLDPLETGWLAGCLARWRDVDLLRIEVRELHLLGARDDLALDSDVVAVLPLG